MSNLTIRVFLSVVIFSALLLLLALVEPAAAAASEVIFSAAWGDKPGEMGLIKKPEQEICGPLSFCTDGRNVFVLDTVHRQIVGIDRRGKQKVIASNVVGWGICADGDGGVFVQDGKRVVHIDREGKIKGWFSVENKSGASAKLIEGYGIEMFLDSEGYLCVRNLNQKVLRVAGAPRMHGNAPGKTVGSSLSFNYRIKRMLSNEVRIIGLDADGKVLVSVPVRLDSGQPGAVLFKGMDANGNLYVEVENIQGKKVELEVHRYSPSGERLQIFKLPNDYFTTVYKKTEITPSGSVYQLLTTPEGVRIIRY